MSKGKRPSPFSVKAERKEIERSGKRERGEKTQFPVAGKNMGPKKTSAFSQRERDRFMGGKKYQAIVSSEREWGKK